MALKNGVLCVFMLGLLTALSLSREALAVEKPTVRAFAPEVFSHHRIIDFAQLSDYVHRPENRVVGHIPAEVMQIGNVFELSFDLQLSHPYWEGVQEQGAVEFHSILSLGPERDSFLDGGEETLAVGLSERGLYFLIHNQHFQRMIAVDEWKGLRQSLDEWQSVVIRCNGYDDVMLQINDTVVARLPGEANDTQWYGQFDYTAPWSYRYHNYDHSIVIAQPGMLPARAKINHLSIRGGRRVINVQ